MKIILTGATGFIGAEVLQQCLANPAIDSIVSLSRRPLDAIADPKLKVVVLKDFTVYDEEVMKALEGAEACIWNLGVTPIKSTANNAEHLRHVSIDYTLAAARACVSSNNAKPEGGKKFRFIYTSGYLTERNQNQNLWFGSDFRKLRGDIENKLIDFETKHPDTFETVITKPATVLGKGNPIPQMLYGAAKAIKVDTLAAAMIVLALNGGEGKQTLENADLEEKGRVAL